MTQVGDGPRAVEPTESPAPSMGEVLAERYQLEQHINNDSAGRQVWRGVDVVLKRPVAVVMRYPGGEPAEEMLSAAVTASRVRQSNLIGVYDAIDEQTRAYVVREWIEGQALRELVFEDGPLDAERTTTIMHSVTEAVAALHASGMAHGNVHPGTTLIADDGRVMLADARVDSSTSFEADVRALGALGYFMLTGTWPRAEAGKSNLPDARRDDSGALIAPHQVRAGVPSYLDDLVMDLLDQDLALPSSGVLMAELARIDTGERTLFGGGEGTLRFAENEAAAAPRRPATPKVLALGGAALALLVTGLVLGIKAINANALGNNTPTTISTTGAKPATPTALALSPSQVRIVDPAGNRSEVRNANLVVDGNPSTAWKTERYTRSNFGGSKPGMGILIRLPEPKNVSSVKVTLTVPGATARLRAGNADPGDSTEGDTQINSTYADVGEPLVNAGTTMVFATDLTTPYQFLLVWFTDLPLESPGKYQIGVQEITVEVQ